MLVLSRKEGESLMIGEEISITILSVEPGGQVNIGISAPKDVLVLRSELITPLPFLHRPFLLPTAGPLPAQRRFRWWTS